MRHFVKVVLLVGSIALLGAGCGVDAPTQTSAPPYPAPVIPQQGTTIVIDDCSATPDILQARSGTEVTFENRDSVAHTLLIEGNETTIPANSSVNVGIETPSAFVGTDFTSNYLCDGASSGAIYLPAR